jgi:hypothetical protein
MTLNIAGIDLYEGRFEHPVSRRNRGSGRRRLRLRGQESSPPSTELAVTCAANALATLPRGEVIPVTWTDSPGDDNDAFGQGGFYVATDADIDTRSHPDSPHATDDTVAVDYALELEEHGGLRATLESRLVGATRSNAHPTTSAGGYPWHAPPPAGDTYTNLTPVGYPTEPTWDIYRYTAENGKPVRVYHDIPQQTTARYLVTPDQLAAEGNARLNYFGLPYPGTGRLPNSANALATFELTNGLVRVVGTPTTGLSFGGTGSTTTTPVGWESAVDVYPTLDGAGGGAFYVTILRNTPHVVAVRLNYFSSPLLTMDLVLRRGAMHISYVIRTAEAATLRMNLEDSGGHGITADLGGYRTRDANDSDGNRWIVGSAAAHTTVDYGDQIEFGEVPSVTSHAGFIGHELGGSSAIFLNEAADVFAQYIEDQSETVRVIR